MEITRAMVAKKFNLEAYQLGSLMFFSAPGQEQALYIVAEAETAKKIAEVLLADSAGPYSGAVVRFYIWSELKTNLSDEERAQSFDLVDGSRYGYGWAMESPPEKYLDIDREDGFSIIAK